MWPMTELCLLVMTLVPGRFDGRDGTNSNKSKIAGAQGRRTATIYPTHNAVDNQLVRTKPVGGRLRRHEDEECPQAAAFPTEADVLSKIEKGLMHDFSNEKGSLTINWLGDGAEYMMVLGTGRTSTDPCNPSLPTNLYTSTDYGTTYSPASGITGLIVDATFSELPDAQGYYVGIAVPHPACSSDGNGFIFITRARGGASRGGSTPTLVFEKILAPWHFSMVVPHYNAHDWFIALGSPSDPSDPSEVPTRAAFVCQIVGHELRCTDLSKAAIVAEWSTTDSDTLFYTTVSESTAVSAVLDLHRFNVSTGDSLLARKGCAHFEQRAGKVLLTDPPAAEDPWKEPNLYVSSDVGTTFTQALFPFPGRTNHFIVAEDSENVLFVAVEHTKTHFVGDTLVKARVNGKATNFNATRALFSDPIDDSSKTFLLFTSLIDPEGCQGIFKGKGKLWNGNDEDGDTIVMMKRGTCTFEQKARIAQSQGAKGVIIYNTDNTHVLYMQAPKETTEFPIIPTVLVSSDTGAYLSAKFGSHASIELQLVEENVKETGLYVQSNMYVSDPSGTTFSLSLDDVFFNSPIYKVSESEFVDLYKVESLPGTYLANQIINTEIVTMISHNNGAHWSPIEAPVDMQLRHCQSEGCRLDIVLQSNNALNDFPLPLSTSSAVGVVIATGSVPGTELFYTVISRDGGHTWHQVEGDDYSESDPEWIPTIYDYSIIDRGAVLIFVPKGVKTTGILYALDEGANGVLRPLTFQQLGVLDSNEAVYIQAVVTEPEAISSVIFLYFWDASGWQGAKIDFGNGLLSPCEETDLMTWSALQGQCLLGAKRDYTRRKHCHVCSPVTADSALAGTVVPCPCTSTDFECGPGYMRPNRSATADTQCATIPFKLPFEHTDCQYVRISGDVCDAKHSKWEGIGETCAVNSSGSGLSAGVIIVILLVVMLGVLLALPSTRPKVVSIFSSGIDTVRGLVSRTTAGFGRTKQSSLYNSLQNDNPYGITGDSDSDSDSANSVDDDDLLRGLDRKDIEGAPEESAQVFGLNASGGLSITADDDA